MAFLKRAIARWRRFYHWVSWILEKIGELELQKLEVYGRYGFRVWDR